MKLSRKNITMQVLSKFIENKKNGDIDFDLYPHFIGRIYIDARAHSDKEPIDITKYVNNYIF